MNDNVPTDDEAYHVPFSVIEALGALRVAWIEQVSEQSYSSTDFLAAMTVAATVDPIGNYIPGPTPEDLIARQRMIDEDRIETAQWQPVAPALSIREERLSEEQRASQALAQLPACLNADTHPLAFGPYYNTDQLRIVTEYSPASPEDAHYYQPESGPVEHTAPDEYTQKSNLALTA